MQMAMLSWAVKHKEVLENTGLLPSLIAALDTALRSNEVA